MYKEEYLNYLYIYFGDIPFYVKTSINSVLSVDKNAKVYLVSDNNPDFKNVTFLHSSEIKSILTRNFIDLNIYNNTSYDFKINKLWIYSLLRVFFISDFLEASNTKNIVHFDSDVMLYIPFEKIEYKFSMDRLNITEMGPDRLVFGYSYIPNKKIIKDTCKEVYNFLTSDEFNQNEDFMQHPLSEMDILAKINKKNNRIFNILPDLPYSTDSMLFDPASYGQYLGGTHQNPRRWYSVKKPTLDHKIGQEISSKRINATFKNKTPSVIYKNKKYNLVNLHVHSKKLQKYRPINFKNYL